MDKSDTIADALRWRRLMELCGKNENADFSTVTLLQDPNSGQYLIRIDGEDKVIPGDSFEMCIDNARFKRVSQ